MSVDRSKVLETAQKHLAKGQFDKAIAELQKIVKEDPQDVRTWLKIGDIFTRKGANREAIETYGRVAEQYAKQGFFLKAVAVYKQILKLDPNLVDYSLSLAEMYEQLALVSDALASYEQVAATYARNGDIDKALSTLGRMVQLDPENIPIRIKYAEGLSKANKTQDAAEAFEAGATLLKEQGRIDDYLKVAERLLFHRPDDMKLARDLAAMYLDRDDAKRALSKLQLCFKADPRDVATLELLAKAFVQLGQIPKTISVYREVARIHQEGNRPEERARALKSILDLDPADAEARQALAGFAPSGTGSGPPPAAVVESKPGIRAPAPRPAMPPPSAVVAAPEPSRGQPAVPPRTITAPVPLTHRKDREEESEAEILIEDDSGVSIEAPPVTGPVTMPGSQGSRAGAHPITAPSIPPEVAREAQIARLLTECDVFLRYGLKSKVVDQLRRILELEPNHVEARERLKDLLIDTGQTAAAVVELVKLSELFEANQSQLSQLYLRQAQELDPDHPAVVQRLGHVEGGGAPPAQAEDEPILETVSEPEAEASADDAILFVDDQSESSFDSTTDEGARVDSADVVQADEGIDVAAYDQPPPATTTGQQVGYPTMQEEQPGELKTVFEHRLELESMPPPVYDSGDLPPISPDEFPRSKVPAPPRTPTPAARVSLRAPGQHVEIEDVLDEADFFVTQGLFDEARQTLNDALASHPNHPLVVEKMEEVEDLAAAAAASAPPPEPAEDESFVLAEKLAEELGPAGTDSTESGSDVLDVEQVFAQFKKGVEEQIGLEDSDTHFDLGIAYKEMGLLDDAIHEFELSMSNPQRECIAQTMMGLCYVEKGNLPEAISHFKKGLYSESKTDREELGLYFELGVAYELLHDPKEALYYYQKVQKRDATFRSVQEKIRQLTQPRPAAAAGATAAAPSGEDVDRAFDDLLGDGD